MHTYYKTRLTRFFPRLVAILSALFLLPLTPYPVFAEQKEVSNLFGSELMDVQDNILSSAILGDTIYVLTVSGLYSWAPGQEKAQKRADFDPSLRIFRTAGEEADAKSAAPVLDLILSDGENLLGLDGSLQTLYALSFNGEALEYKELLKLDLEEFILGDQPYRTFQSPEWAQVVDGLLYIKRYSWENTTHDLFTYDLKTGQKTALDLKYASAFTPYKDGKFVVVQFDYNNSYDPQTGDPIPPKLAVYNPQDKSLETLDTVLKTPPMGGGIPHFYYDKGEDALFTYTDSDIYRYDGDLKEAKLIGYLPMYNNFFGGGDVMPLPDGRLAFCFSQNIFLREKTEKDLDSYSVLRMAGTLDDGQILTRILMEMDKVVIRSVDNVQYNQISEEQLAAMFLTRNVPVDIMVINSNSFDIEKLIEKGYLADLSSSAKIMDYTKSLAPNLSRSFYDGEKAYVMPVSLMAFPISAYLKPLAQIGEALPTTLQEYADLALRWVEELGEKNPEFIFAGDSGNLKRTLISQIIERYSVNLLGAGEELTFDTPIFKELMQKVLSAEFGDYGREIDWESPEEMAMMEEMWQKKPLFDSGMGFDPQYSVMANRSSEEEGRYQTLLLSLEKGKPAYLEASVNLLAVMEPSQNKEVAIQFLEHFLDKMDPLIRSSLDFSVTAPIPNPNYEAELKNSENNLKRYQEQVEKAQGAEKSNLEESLKYMQTYHENLKKHGQFRATEEDLREMHEIISHFFLFSGLGNAQRKTYWDEYDLVDQMISGVISLDQFVKQMDDKLRLVRMESQ